VESIQALPLWLPPVSMHNVYATDPAAFDRNKRWDRRMCKWPVFRACGDYFIMVLRHTSAPPEHDIALPDNETGQKNH
jgi:hypothetical protein